MLSSINLYDIFGVWRLIFYFHLLTKLFDWNIISTKYITSWLVTLIFFISIKDTSTIDVMLTHILKTKKLANFSIKFSICYMANSSGLVLMIFDNQLMSYVSLDLDSRDKALFGLALHALLDINALQWAF